MVMGIPMEWLAIVTVLACMVAFFIGQAMHGVMRDQGFGVFGNMLILSSGFALGVFAADHLRWRLAPDELTALGLASAFSSLFLLAVAKRVLLKV